MSKQSEAAGWAPINRVKQLEDRIATLEAERDEVAQHLWMMWNPNSVTTYEDSFKWLKAWLEQCLARDERAFHEAHNA